MKPVARGKNICTAFNNTLYTSLVEVTFFTDEAWFRLFGYAN
jgi:hypothetical protein